MCQRSFDIMCKVGLVHMGGQGASKKEAKRKAAADLLEHLTEAGPGAHALVFGKDGKEGQEELKLSKAIQDLSLDVQAAKLQDLQRTSLKSRCVYMETAMFHILLSQLLWIECSLLNQAGFHSILMD